MFGLMEIVCVSVSEFVRMCVCVHALWFIQPCKGSAGVFSASGTGGLRMLEKSAEECRLCPKLDIFSEGVEERNVVKLCLAALPFEEVSSRFVWSLAESDGHLAAGSLHITDLKHHS